MLPRKEAAWRIREEAREQEPMLQLHSLLSSTAQVREGKKKKNKKLKENNFFTYATSNMCDYDLAL